MKRMILSTVLIVILGTASFAQKLVAEGKTFSALGDYKIVSAENPVTLKGTDCKAFKISYANNPIDVTVVVCKDRKCRRYVVLSDQLSIQYVCNANYFGVERLDKSFEAEGYKTNESALNRSEYFHQKALGSGQKDEMESTRLVAAYFPFLINDMTGTTATR